MIYCKNCGTELAAKQTFCTKCGTKVAAVNKVRKPLPDFKRYLTLKTILPAAIVVALLVILAGVNWILEGQSKPMTVVEEFQTVIEERDVAKLAELVNDGQTVYQMTEEEAATYIDYLTEQHHFPSLLEALKMQALIGAASEPVTDAAGNNLFQVRKLDDKKWLLYDQHQLFFYPVELMVSANLEGARIWLDGAELEETTLEGSFIHAGYMFPGEHEVKAEFAGDYSQLQTEAKLDFLQAENNQLATLLEFESTSVELATNIADAILFVNGKDTGMEVGEIASFGPVLADGSVTLHAERTADGETEQTEPVQIYDQAVVEFLFDEKQVIEKADIAQFMDGYFTTMVRSINERDLSISEAVLDLNGNSYPEHKSYLVLLEERGITEEYLGMELLSFEKVDEGYLVRTNEEYHIFYGDGSGKYKSFQSEFLVSIHDEELKVHSLVNTNELDSQDL